MTQRTIPTAICATLLIASATQAVSFRSVDGSGNNIANPDWGKANTQLLRMATPAYEDGLSVPRGGDPSTLPSARLVSNAVSAQTSSIPNAAKTSDWIWQWGQFLDHDLDLTVGADPAEEFNIIVPTGDPSFDPFNTGTQEMPFGRSDYDPATGTTNARQQVNQITSYIDGSQVYGSDTTRADELRTMAGDGKLKTSTGDLLPFNTAGLPNAGGDTNTGLFLAGDIRANEQVGLTATHTLFMREHNLLADEIKTKIDGADTAVLQKLADSGLSEGDFIYQVARKIVGAKIQAITYNEYLPVLLGDGALPAFTGYDDTVDAGISNEFSTAAFRFGHTQLPNTILRVSDGGGTAPEGNLSFADAFFSPGEITSNGIESLLLGLATGRSEEVDTLLVDGIRDFLFGPPGAGGLDLGAMDIQRVRDHGLPDINTIRSAFGLLPHADFIDLTGGDVALANSFASVYTTVDDVDVWIGGLAETHFGGGILGETFHKIIADQFIRLRDGDRFFFLEELDHLLVFDGNIESTRLSDIIRRNTDIASIQDNAFLVVVPEPVTGVLGLLSLATLSAATRRRSA